MILWLFLWDGWSHGETLAQLWCRLRGGHLWCTVPDDVDDPSWSCRRCTAHGRWGS